MCSHKKSKALANYFYFLAKEDNDMDGFTPMKNIKLSYIAHGYSLALDQGGLISKTDAIQAWEWGPVIRSLYPALKKYQGSEIKFHIPDCGADSLQEAMSAFNGEQQKILEHVWEKYGLYDGLQLSWLTHKKETPWDQVFEENKNIPISDDIIKPHYIKILTNQWEY